MQQVSNPRPPENNRKQKIKLACKITETGLKNRFVIQSQAIKKKKKKKKN